MAIAKWVLPVPVPPTSTTLRILEGEVDILGERHFGDGELISDRARLLPGTWTDLAAGPQRDGQGEADTDTRADAEGQPDGWPVRGGEREGQGHARRYADGDSDCHVFSRSST